jgi:hypothetical protein
MEIECRLGGEPGGVSFGVLLYDGKKTCGRGNLGAARTKRDLYVKHHEQIFI